MAEEGSGRFFPKLEGSERKEALEDPGPTWRQYFYFSFAKVWTVLGFFVGDTLLLAFWAVPLNVAGLVLSFVAAVYGEFLLYQYLWHRPAEPIRGKPFRPFEPSWLHPVPYGRWTIEAERVRAGNPLVNEAVDEGPNPEEFL